MDEKIISQFIEQQFPEIYREEGPFLIEFLKQYYAWLESDSVSPVYQARRHMSNHDIDTTVDQFLIYYKEKYLKNIQINTATNTKRLIKNAIDLYRSKGSENAIKLFFDLIFSAESDVYYPGTDVFRLSNATWTIPYYLEVTSSPINRLLVGRAVEGLNSGAQGFVEKLVRRKVKNYFVEILYVSAVTGTFETGEIVKLIGNTTTPIGEFPTIIGSLTNLTIEDGGTGFAKGDVVTLTSRTGEQGVGLVTELEAITGVVDFTLEDGGWGYSVNTEVHVSEKVLGLANAHIRDSSNNSLEGRILHVYQPTANVQWYNNTAFFGTGNTVFNYYANGTLIGSSRIISAEYGTNTTTNFFLLNNLTGNNYMDPAQPYYYTAGNTASFQVQNAGWVDTTASGDVVGMSSNVAVTCVGNSALFSVGDTAYQISSNNLVYASSLVKEIIQNTTNIFTLKVTNLDGLFLTNQKIVSTLSGGTANISSAAYDLGLDNISGNFSIANGNVIVDTGNTSLWNASVTTTSFGAGANTGIDTDFLNAETVSLCTTFIRDHLAAVPNNNINATSYGTDLHNANLTNMSLANAFTFVSKTIGTIAGLENENPGLGYSYAPFVNVIDPLVAPLDKRDFVIRFSSSTGVFANGELVTQALNGAKGTVKFANTTEVHLRRLTFDDRWTVGNSSNSYLMIGTASGVSAYPSEVTYDTDGIAGHNAIISTEVESSNSAVTSLKVTDSGFAFRDGDEVTFTSEDGLRSGLATASVVTMGHGSGFYKSTASQLSSNKYLYDGEYYQDFSYEIRSPITVSRYADMLKSVLHVSGTKAFSALVKNSVVGSENAVMESSVLQANTANTGGGGGGGGIGGNTAPMLFQVSGFDTSFANFTADNSTQRFTYPQVAVDTNGSVIVGGVLSNQAVLSKYDSVGAVIFQKHLTDWDVIAGVSVDLSDDSIYAIATSGSNSFVVKFDTNGALVWSKQLTSVSLAGCYFANNTFYVTGWINDTSSFAVTFKYDTSGNVSWQRTFGDATHAQDVFGGYSIYADSSGTVYVGYQLGNSDTYGVIVYDASGTELWSKVVSTGSSDYLWPVVTADDNGDVYVATNDFDFSNMLISKIAADGSSLLWQKRIYLGDGSNWYYEVSQPTLLCNGTDVYLFAHTSTYAFSSMIVIKLDPATGGQLNCRYITDDGQNGYESLYSSKACLAGNNIIVTSDDMYNTVDRFQYLGIARIPLETTDPVQFTNQKLGVSSPTEVFYQPVFVTTTHTMDDATTNHGLAENTHSSTISNNVPTIVSYSNTNWAESTTILGAETSYSGNNWLRLYGEETANFDFRTVGFFDNASDSSGTVCIGYDESYPNNYSMITKFNSSGSIVWQEKIAGPASAWDDWNILVDPSDSAIYAVGTDNFSQKVTVFKFDTNGSQIWQRTYTGMFTHGGMAMDSTYLYIGGSTFSTPDMTVVKVLKSNGTISAQATSISTGGQIVRNVAIASDGGVLVLMRNSVGQDMILMKMNAALTSITWQRLIADSSELEGAKILVSGTDIYVVADGYGVTSPNSIVILKYNSSGVLQFSRYWNGINGTFASGPNNNSKGAVLLNNNIYVKAAANHDVGPGQTNRSADIALLKFDLTGAFVWGSCVSGGGENDDRAFGISTDGTDIYMSGTFQVDNNLAFIMRVTQNGLAPGVYGGHWTVRNWPMTEQTVSLTDSAASLTALSDPGFTDAASSYAVTTNSGLQVWATPLGEGA
jgi:hypothetical protein